MILVPRPFSVDFGGELLSKQRDGGAPIEELQRAVRILSSDTIGAYQFNSGRNFLRSGYTDIRAFFDEIYEDYDSDKVNPYWSFAHEILRHIISTHFYQHFRSDKPHIYHFDAGAGTGNWSQYLLDLDQRIQTTLFDMNSNMLSVAQRKIDVVRHRDRTQIIEGNLEQRGDYPTRQYDLITCFHNVIGLGRNTDRILTNLCAHLSNGGLALIMAPNKYWALAFSLRSGNKSEADRVIHDSSIKFKPDMPEMFCYTPQEFQQRLIENGFGRVSVLGFPVTIYPEEDDTKLKRKGTSNYDLLNPLTRRIMLEMEKRLCLNPEMAYRGGSSLIAICQKNPLPGNQGTN